MFVLFIVKLETNGPVGPGGNTVVGPTIDESALGKAIAPFNFAYRFVWIFGLIEAVLFGPGAPDLVKQSYKIYNYIFKKYNNSKNRIVMKNTFFRNSKILL